MRLACPPRAAAAALAATALAATARPARPLRPTACAASSTSAAAAPIDGDGQRRAEAYLDAVLAANADMNLTAVRDRPAALLRHLADSFDFLPPLDAAAVGRPSFSVIDVGSGAGFPGAALAAARPGWRVTLVDSLRKRVDFAGRAAVRAGIPNCGAVWGRAEELGAASSPPSSSSSSSSLSLRESADAVTARAVADLRVLAELCLPFVKVGGVWVAAKGPSPDDEVAAAASAIATLGGGPPTVHRLPPLGEGLPARTLVVVVKRRATPAAYPRRPGTPAKRPL